MLQIRVDDFPGTKPAEFHKHNLESYRKFHDVLARNGIKEYHLGVIPRHTSQEDLRGLVKLEGLKVALHGIDHDESYPNEFRAYLTAEDIRIRLANQLGLWYHSVGASHTPDAYIPPHNVIDRRTVDALIMAGFAILFGGPGSDPDVLRYAYDRGMDVRYSNEGTEYGRSDEIIQRGFVPNLANVWSSLSAQKVTLTLHFPWEVNIGLDNLDRMLKMITGVQK